jgi:hypothetical protein
MGSRRALVVVLSRRSRTKATQRRVEERHAAKKCLMKIRNASGVLVDCDNDGTKAKGLCSTCYDAMLEHAKSLEAKPEERDRFIAEQVSLGQMLDDGEATRLRSKYPFKNNGVA